MTSRRSAGRALLWTALAWLGACTVGPDYRRPPVAVPEGWKESVPADQDVRGNWWAKFGDHQLAEYIEKAVPANQTVAQALGRAAEAEAALRLVGAQQYPALSLDPSALRQKLFTGLTSDATARRSLFQVPLNLSYEVDLWGRVRRSVEASGATYQASLAELEAIKLGVASEVAQTWFMLRHVDLDRRLLRETVTLRRQTQDLVETRLRNGVASQLEVAQSRIELAQAESDLAGLDRSRALLEHSLAQLSGQPAPSMSFADRPLDVAVPSVPVLLPAELLERRPDVAQAERRMISSNAAVGVAEAAYFPTLNLAGLLGFESTSVRHLFSASNLIWSLGAAASQPLFQGGALDANADVARAQYAQSLAAYRQTVLVAFQEVEDALSTLSVLGRQAEAQDRAVQSSREATTLARRRYEEGLASMLDLVDAQRSLLLAQRGANLIYRDRLLASVLLVRAMGGGWDARTAALPSH
jgi:outer membrane protein, multidrug efflux system